MRRVSLPNQLNETRRRSPTRGERIFGGYNTSDVYAMAFDEMFDAQGIVRGPYKGIYAELAPSDASNSRPALMRWGVRSSTRASRFRCRARSGRSRSTWCHGSFRPQWTRLERGITQRVKALECYLDDIYGDQEILRDGVIPRRLVTSCEHFHRQAVGIVPPNGVRIHVAGIDLIRDHRGDFRVLEDNLRSPSGCRM